MHAINQDVTEPSTTSAGLYGVSADMEPFTCFHPNHSRKNTDIIESVQNEAYLNTFLSEEYTMNINRIQRSTIHLQGANLTIDDSNFESIQKQDKLEFTSNTGPGCLDVTSVSAVSSLRSEKVQTASEGDWDKGTGSDRENGRRYFTDQYDYSSNTRNFISRHTSAVQKKYHMFGRRCLHEEATQNTIVYSKMQILNSQESFLDCDALVNSAFLNFEEHDAPIGNESNSGFVRDNLDCTSFEFNCHLTRDEKRARNLHVPIPVPDIINLPMDEFNERLSKYDLNENQLSLIRDIRRRGKNKVAAQNCRKRKLDTILSLEGEVQEVRRRKEKLLSERSLILTEKKRIANKFSSLHNLIFQYLRDSEGNLCSPSNFSFQIQPDGSMILLPRSNSKLI
ncbi:segmentation protein cap'n'collar-like isoform X2 [Eupeodes corollae]|uniref:segmentation protein cap'n'collar-like isoform X2 n=1 Tax=Eupeodes corollae TaxID=290404 RepID=UPI00248FB297|nr:segmentation protein cap'n'collar-like isoform X2 [Eupeodes corollae]